MKPEEIAVLLREQFGEKVLESKLDSLNPWSVVAPPAILEVCQFLKADNRLLFDHLELLGGVDFKDRIEVVYILYSMALRHRYTLKCRLARENPVVQSVESVWRAADWHERETYDMFGVVFSGHGDLRRILCPDDWEGYPLRKDYRFPEHYKDMPV
jgi:NADH-quinone oxidoreductase subunit C